MEWNEAENERQQNYCLKWSNGASVLSQFRVPQCHYVSGDETTDTQLYIFCDAWEAAYGAVT